MVLDMMDHVAELKPLDLPFFPIEYCCTTVHVPIMDKSKIRVSIVDYQPVVKLIEELECHFSAAVHPRPLPPTLPQSTSLLDLVPSMQLLLCILIAILASMD